MTPNDPRHGSVGGYRAHKRDGETPCPTCRTAYNKRQRDLRAGRTVVWCQRCKTTRTEAASGICSTCTVTKRLSDAEADLALTGGQWVPRDGIMRWVAA